MAVALHRIRFFYKLRPFNLTESLISFHSLTCRASCVRCLHRSHAVFGLEEFFPPGVIEKGELAPESVNTGRKWRAGELRGKSNEDLHKLWYVLLKERNMLLTLRHEAKRQGVPMPSPTRLHKVQKSMTAIKTVIAERERLLKILEQETWPFDTIEEKQSTADVELVKEDSNVVVNDDESQPGFFNKLKRKLLPGM
ncbi:unnamed protein product [Porites evermanni]|uniref:Large ribosomal subunit protein uL29m n=1 Tax=Porites evermanni TaxID=104178 RepID=A0ABN8N7W8_9CNID|nr:unnamed protein product [Porites evermanni]